MNILLTIQKKYSTFSDKEKSIADFILSQKENLKNISIKDLANKTETSAATITRFSKKIGCQSFVDMKIGLNATKVEKNIKEDDSVLSNVYNYYSEVIERTKQLINKESIYKLVDQIKKSKRIYIYGVGSSGLTAAEMMQRLIRMGFNIHSISDSHMMIINSSIVSKEDLVIGISISGETEEIVDALKICKKNGAKTVSITSFDNSSITKYSDMKFIVYNTVFVDKKRFINTQFSAMYVLDLICTVLLNDEKLSKKLQITVDAIINS